MIESDRVSDPLLLCRVASRLCGLPVGHVVETMRPLPVEPIAGVAPFVLGVSIVRGSPLPVVSAESLLVGTGDSSRATRFLAVKISERRFVLVVDSVVGVARLSASSWSALPPLLREARTDAVESLGTLDGDLLMLLEGARIVPESVWSTLESGQGRG